jgi:hypothetical protein
MRPRPNPLVGEWINSRDESDLYLSVLTVGELRKGVLRLAEGRRRSGLVRWLENDVKRRFAGRLLPVDLEVGELWGHLTGQLAARGRTLPVIDSLLAATALHHHLIVVTRNVEDFAAAGVRVENPWS